MRDWQTYRNGNPRAIWDLERLSRHRAAKLGYRVHRSRRQHRLGAGPRRGGKPHERREIAREPASGRREPRGATQLNPGTDPTCASTGASILTLFHLSRRRGEEIVDRSNDSPIENGYALRRKILPQTGAEFDDRVPEPFKVAHSASRKIMQ